MSSSQTLSFALQRCQLIRAAFDCSAPVGEDGDVAINPTNSNYVYAFTISGFQWSSDSGHAFRFSLPGSEWAFSGGTSDLIAFDPVRPGTLYVAAKDGVFKSTNYGSTMTLLPWPYTQTTLVAVDPELNNTIFVGTGNGLLRHFQWREQLDPSQQWNSHKTRSYTHESLGR